MASVDRTRLRKAGIRVLGLVIVAACVYMGVKSGGCPSTGCPGYALGDELLLRGERAGLALVVLTGAAAMVWRLARGELPTRVGRDGYDWPELGETTAEALEAMQKENRRLREEVDRLRETIEEVAASTEAGLRDLAASRESGSRQRRRLTTSLMRLIR